MRILILVPKFPNIVQTYIVSTIVGLKRLGIKTIILARKSGSYTSLPPAISNNNLLSNTVYINSEGFEFFKAAFSLPLTNKKYLKALLTIIFSDINKIFGFTYFIKSLVYGKILAAEEIDIIHSHSFFTSYDYLFLKETFGIPMVATFHGHIPRGVNNLDDKKVAKVIRYIDTFFVNTPFSKCQLLDMGCDEEKIQIIPQGTEISAFPYSQKNISEKEVIRILTVGRLSIEKGHATSIQAIGLIAQEFPMLEYNIIGEGDERESLSSLINKLHLQETISLHGLTSNEELSHFYSTSHIFILPSIDLHDGSHVETQGVVLQEAQSSGLAVIASRTGGIPAVISDNETGLLFNEGDAEDLANKIRDLIYQQKKYSQICLAGRKDVETRFDIDVICKKLATVYKNNINRDKT